MTSVLRFIYIFAACFSLVACGQNGGSSHNMPAVGTKAIINAHGNELQLEITAVDAGIVVWEVSDWHGQVASHRHYYRGLYPMALNEGSQQWDLEFDTKKIDALFPLEPGKITSFSGTMMNITEGRSYDFWTKIQVKGKKLFQLPSGNHTVYVLKVVRESEVNGRVRQKYETLYYAPDLQMILKGVVHEEAYQRYWRIVSIIKPEDASVLGTTPRQRRRAGTVLI